MSFTHLQQLENIINTEELNNLREFLKNMKWNYKIPGGFVTNFPQRKVNTFGNGQGIDDDGNLIGNKWGSTCWTAKQTQNDVTLKTSVEELPEKISKIVPEIKNYLKTVLPEIRMNNYTFSIAVCNHYTQPDMTIAAHTDDQEWYPNEVENKPMFASLTFYLYGKPSEDKYYSRFQLKKNEKWEDVKLEDNSILFMNSSIPHRVLKHKKKDEKFFRPRINITLRSTFDPKINPLMNYMSVANHSRYYRQPLELIVAENFDLSKIDDMVESYNNFCMQNDYEPIKISTNKLHNIKNNLKIKYNNYIKKYNLHAIKYKCNMVTEALQHVCELLK
jgi:hypothetical protein